MRRNLRTFLLVVSQIGLAQSALAALGDQYDSYYDLHTKTAYGAVFFNKDAIRYEESRTQKRFIEITENGAIALPKQRGYCFVFNHYRPELEGKEIRYTIQITKKFSDGKVTTEPLDRIFSITSNTVSSSLPDVCVSGIQNVVDITIATTSNYGSDLDWKFTFRLN